MLKDSNTPGYHVDKTQPSDLQAHGNSARKHCAIKSRFIKIYYRPVTMPALQAEYSRVAFAWLGRALS